MRTWTHNFGGYNSMFVWAYLDWNHKRSIWVHSMDKFGFTGRAVIDDFGNLVPIK